MLKKTLPALALLTAILTPLQSLHASSQPEATAPTQDQFSSATTFFKDLKNNAHVTNPFKVEFVLNGMKIAPAGTSTKPGTGHFHLLIDTKLTENQKAMPLPTDAQHLDFPGGQSQVDLNLPNGKHTLQIVMGDGRHKLHNPPIMSEIITVIVE